MQSSLRFLFVALIAMLFSGNAVFADSEATALLRGGEAKYSSGDLRGAIIDYNRAIELDPKFAPAWLNRAIAKRALGDGEGARADFTKAIEVDPTPKDAEAYYNRGSAKSAIGDNEGAARDFNRAAMLGDLPEGKLPENKSGKGAGHAVDEVWQLLKSGEAKFSAGNSRGAVIEYNRAIALNPKLAPAWFNRGIAKRALGDGEGARADFTKAIEVDPTPKDAEAYSNRGSAKSAIGDRNGALADYRKASMLGDRNAEKWLQKHGYK